MNSLLRLTARSTHMAPDAACYTHVHVEATKRGKQIPVSTCPYPCACACISMQVFMPSRASADGAIGPLLPQDGMRQLTSHAIQASELMQRTF
jgi:hypothetical protein